MGKQLARSHPVGAASEMTLIESILSEIRKLEERRCALVGELATVQSNMLELRAAAEKLAEAYEFPVDDLDAIEILTEDLMGGGVLINAVRAVLTSDDRAFRGLTATAIRDAITDRKLWRSQGKNPLSSIHTTLKRLVARGEIEEIRRPDGVRYFLDQGERGQVARKLGKETP